MANLTYCVAKIVVDAFEVDVCYANVGKAAKEKFQNFKTEGI